jgi:UDP-glucose 4-epimerase
MNILIIGGNGFIGINLIKELLNQNNFLFIYLRENSKNEILKLSSYKNIEIIYGTLNDVDLITKLIKQKKIKLFIHLASSLLPSSKIEDYHLEQKNIIEPTMELLPILAKYNVRIIYFSSGGTIYGKNKSGTFCEHDKLNPISYYGLSKLFLEEIILFENRKSGLEYLILRPSNPFGPGQKSNKNQGLINVIIEKGLTGSELEIWGNGDAVRDYIYITDLVKAVIKLIRMNIKNEIFNISSNYGLSIIELIQVIELFINKKIKIKYLDSRENDLSKVILNNNKLIKHIGIFNQNQLNENIKGFIDYKSEKLKYE